MKGTCYADSDDEDDWVDTERSDDGDDLGQEADIEGAGSIIVREEDNQSVINEIIKAEFEANVKRQFCDSAVPMWIRIDNPRVNILSRGIRKGRLQLDG